MDQAIGRLTVLTTARWGMAAQRSARRTRRDAEVQLSPEEFRDVIGHFASGVTVITVRQGDTSVGTTASAVCSLSLEPPMVLICMNRTSSTGQAVADVGEFAVNILSEDQAALAQRFATKASDKFNGV